MFSYTLSLPREQKKKKRKRKSQIREGKKTVCIIGLLFAQSVGNPRVAYSIQMTMRMAMPCIRMSLPIISLQQKRQHQGNLHSANLPPCGLRGDYTKNPVVSAKGLEHRTRLKKVSISSTEYLMKFSKQCRLVQDNLRWECHGGCASNSSLCSHVMPMAAIRSGINQS